MHTADAPLSVAPILTRAAQLPWSDETATDLHRYTFAMAIRMLPGRSTEDLEEVVQESLACLLKQLQECDDVVPLHSLRNTIRGYFRKADYRKKLHPTSHFNPRKQIPVAYLTSEGMAPVAADHTQLTELLDSCLSDAERDFVSLVLAGMAAHDAAKHVGMSVDDMCRFGNRILRS